nr:IS21 family transposase [Dietzia sp. UCD-THP]
MTVRKIRAKLVLQLRAEGLSGRAIAASQGMSRKSIAAVLEAADATETSWDDVAELSDEQVYARLFPGRGEHESVFAQPDWEQVHREMARVGVTLKLLHGEYIDRCAATRAPAMGYDRWCKTYQRYVMVTGAASRVGHKAGQTVEVDWSGPTMELTDPVTGARRKVYLFVACLPFSRFAFVWPSTDMQQDAWLRAHVAMFDAFGGSVPRIVCDNLKTGVVKHPRDGEIVLNDAYREMAAHYSAAVLPGRIRRPKDKSGAENTVAHVATWVIAGLRARTFHTVPELAEAIGERMDAYNREPFGETPRVETQRVHRRGAAAAHAAAGGGVRDQPVALRPPGGPQWSRGVRAELLLGPAGAHRYQGRSADHRPHAGDLPRHRADLQPPAAARRRLRRVPHQRCRPASRPPVPAVGCAPGTGVGRAGGAGGGDCGQPDLRIRARRRTGPGRRPGGAAPFAAVLSRAGRRCVRAGADRAGALAPVCAYPPDLATGQDKTAALRPPPAEAEQAGGYVRGADYYARSAR